MKTAIITGGAGGMGLATARIMGRDHAVVIADMGLERLGAAVDALREDGIDATAIECDVTDRAAVESLVATGDATGELRAVVHTAGVSPLMGDASSIARINALGTVHVTEAALAVAREGFALVNVASIAGHMTPKALQPTRTFKRALTDADGFAARLDKAVNRGPAKMRSGSAYSTSKAFVIWYSREMAAAFGAKGARVVSVSPGSFDTSMGRLEKKSGSGKLTEYAALKRFGRPEEVAEVLAFCASALPGYVTGTDILVDGGTRAGLTPRGMLAMARG
ncbi:SDR family NAD(P)-dependent oxidoreductase [Demequina pelophila]|uniref:SDR family NAD(P)-dependent oxidoreductase n=1 Tax=Demequina pelophila TaxID=1638984 RepID=UPI0007863445|nr:SDR family oxidoreductase [Demequina pelophila]